MSPPVHILIADAHLRSPKDPAYRRLLALLSRLSAPEVAAVHLLGDTFNAWGMWRGRPYRRFAPLLEALAALRTRGCRVVLYEGNRDFGLRPLQELYGFEVCTGSRQEALCGRPTLLLHGDLWCTHEPAMLRLRSVLRSAPAAFLQRHLPEALGWPLFEALRGVLGLLRCLPPAPAAPRPLPAPPLCPAMSAPLGAAEQVVLGHYHRFAALPGPPPLWVLPDWESTGCYAVAGPDGLRLEKFEV